MYRNNLPTITATSHSDSTDPHSIVPEQISMMKRKPWPVLMVCAVSLFWASCDQTSNIGGGLIPDRNVVKADTIPIPPLSNQTIDAYTGDLTHLSSGAYNDPFFGPISAESYLIPSLLGRGLVDTLNEDTRATFRMRISSFYGDTLQPARFGVYGVRSYWRPSTFRASTVVNVDAEPFVTFEVTNDSIVTVDLPQTWLNEYKTFVYNTAEVPDSIYIRNYFGLSIRPMESGKIFSAIKDSISITFFNPTDTNLVAVRASAYSYTRQALPITTGGVHISSNQENLPTFKLQVDVDRLAGVNISRAVIRLDEDELFKQAQLPEGHVRPSSIVVNAYNPQSLLNPDDIIILIPSLTFIQQDDGSYQANVTNLVRQMLVSRESERTYLLSIQPRSGILHNTMIDQSQLRRPKLLLTIVTREGL